MTAETSPTSRALQVLELLQNQPGTTADQLAAELGVTERAARRYVGILREAEIPIISVRGRYGGYSVGRGVRLPPLVFSATEALGMVMAVLEGHHEATDSTDPVANALRKIMRALPEAVAAQAELVRRTARPVPNRYAAPADPSITAQLVHASSMRRVVELTYLPQEGSGWTSRVEPWAVVVRQGRWYLLARRVSSGAMRTYRLDRVRGVTLMTDEFELPEDIDPVALLEANFAVGWEFATEVDIAAPAEEHGRMAPAQHRPGGGGRRRQLPAAGQHQRPGLVRRDAGLDPGAVPGGVRPGAARSRPWAR